MTDKAGSGPGNGPSDFFPIRLDTLREESVVDFDVWIEQEDQIVLYRQSGMPLDSEVIDRLTENKITQLLVRLDDRQKFCSYVESHLSTIIDDPKLDEPEKARAVNLVATNLAQELIVEPDGDNVGRAQKLFVMMSAHADHKPDFLASAIRAASTDGQLQTHCVNMAVYSIALGSYLKIGDAAVLGDFAVAGFLADIGKSYVPPEILLKPAQLDDDDWKHVQRHPIQSVELVGRHFPDNSLIVEAIMQHHLRIDGSGYPKLRGDGNVDLMGQVVGIADAFDGITMERPDRPKSASFEALKILTQEMRGKFDDVLLKSFILCLGDVASGSIRSGK